jgi:hypothetical protein
MSELLCALQGGIGKKIKEILGTQYYQPLRQLRRDEIDNRDLVAFIRKYGGDADGNADSWGEIQLQFVLDIRNWKLEEIQAKVAQCEAEWARPEDEYPQTKWGYFPTPTTPLWYGYEEESEEGEL